MRFLIKLWSYLPAPFKLPILKVVQSEKWLYRPVLFRYVDAKDRANGANGTLPPAELRYRVSSSPEAESFTKEGEACAADIESALSTIGRDLSSFETILDFGCGCGRTLIPLSKRLPSAQIHGADIDPSAIAWCQKHLTFGQFAITNETPPTSYQPEVFDLIYAISVFTHLDENNQFRWLDELRRITRPGGIVIITVDSSRAGEQGFVFEPTYERGLFPGWYQNAFHSKHYVTEKFAKYFQVLNQIQRGMNKHQDVVVLQRADVIQAAPHKSARTPGADPY